MGIWIRDWGLEIGIEIGDWDKDWGLGLGLGIGIRIGDWDGSGIGDWEFGIENRDWGLG